MDAFAIFLIAYIGMVVIGIIAVILEVRFGRRDDDYDGSWLGHANLMSKAIIKAYWPPEKPEEPIKLLPLSRLLNYPIKND